MPQPEIVTLLPGHAPRRDRQPLSVNAISVSDIPKWLRLGYQDFRRSGFPSIVHGLIVALAGIVILSLGRLYWPVVPGAVSGFVLIGPILATGLYALSRCREESRPATFQEVLHAWGRSSRCLFVFGLVLVAAGSAWVVVSLLYFHFFVQASIDGVADFFRYVINQNDRLFMLWAIAGGIGTALLFAITVVSVPLIFDHQLDTPTAILTSVRAVGDNPYPMVCWALVIAAITGVGIATFMIGFVIVYPVLGHASWHAYRDLVDPPGVAAGS